MVWKDVSWIIRGRLKKRIIAVMNSPKTATMLSKELKTHRSTISGILLEMEKKKILKCLDPKQPYSRFYEITSYGKKIIREVKKVK